MPLFQMYTLRTLIFQKSKHVITMIYNTPPQGYTVIEAHESQVSQQFLLLFSQLEPEQKYRAEKLRTLLFFIFLTISLVWGYVKRSSEICKITLLSCVSLFPYSLLSSVTF